MKVIMSFIYNLITSPLQIFDNVLVNVIIMKLIGKFTFKIAFNKVDEIGARGSLGSFLHWTIRTIVFVVTWFVISMIINIITFIIKVPIEIWIAICLLIMLIKLIAIATKNSDSILNKKYYKHIVGYC